MKSNNINTYLFAQTTISTNKFLRKGSSFIENNLVTYLMFTSYLQMICCKITDTDDVLMYQYPASMIKV